MRREPVLYPVLGTLSESVIAEHKVSEGPSLGSSTIPHRDLVKARSTWVSVEILMLRERVDELLREQEWLDHLRNCKCAACK